MVRLLELTLAAVLLTVCAAGKYNSVYFYSEQECKGGFMYTYIERGVLLYIITIICSHEWMPID